MARGEMIRRVFIIVIVIANAGCSPIGPENDQLPALQQLPGPKMVRDCVSAVIRPDGTVWTWGPGSCGTLGTGSLQSSDIPVQARGIHDAVALDLFAGIAVSADNSGNIHLCLISLE